MGKVAVDFGTGNTVMARLNEANGAVETMAMPGITTEFRYRLGPNHPEQVVHVAPSLIHYSEKETLIGDQVLSRGLAEHRHTIRWMKRGIAQEHTQRRPTPQGHKSPAQAGEDFLKLLLGYAGNLVSFRDDEFTFTVPVEAFEHFEDWLRRIAESLGIRRLRVLDEPTASVFGYQDGARADDRFIVFDFGCGTLDVSAVRFDRTDPGNPKAVQLGKAGADLGGMDIDQWLADDFCSRHGLEGAERRELDAVILRQAEQVKIELSRESEAQMTVLADARSRLFQTTYTCHCDACRRGEPGRNEDPTRGCLGCLLLARGFTRRVRETVELALENATLRAGMRRADVTRVMVIGGTSLMPCVRQYLTSEFDSRVDLERPFDAVARGACRGVVLPFLQHDYAIEGFSRSQNRYVFTVLFKSGDEYPTDPQAPVQLWLPGSVEGQTRLGLFIYEVSKMKRRDATGPIIGEDGRLCGTSRVQTQFEYRCLNRKSPTFIVADPPVNLERDKKRFLCSFRVDEHRRLLVTVIDNLTSKTMLKDHPVVRL